MCFAGVTNMSFGNGIYGGKNAQLLRGKHQTVIFSITNVQMANGRLNLLKRTQRQILIFFESSVARFH